MKGEFVIREGSAIITYEDFDEIPMEFDNLISVSYTHLTLPTKA